MSLGGWLVANWFDVFSSAGIIGSLSFTAVTLHKDAKTRRVANMLALVQSHRELWQGYSRNAELTRVLDAGADLSRDPVTPAEREFVNLVIQHLASVFRAMQSDLTIAPDAMRRDVRDFFLLPIPRAVWDKLQPFQDLRFVRFVEQCLGN